MDSKMFQLDQMDQFGLEPADMDTFNMTAVNPEELLQLDSACPSLFGGLMQFDSNNKHNNSDSSPCQSPDGPVFPAFEGLNFCNNLSINTNYVLQRGNAPGSCDSINDTDTNSNISPAGSEDLRKSNSCNSSEATQDHKKVANLDLVLDLDLDMPAVHAAPAMAQVQPRFNYFPRLQGSMNTDPALHNEGNDNGMGAMREMIFRVAAMQPIQIDPESIKRPKRRNVRISKDPQSVAARHRRERISERIRILQRLVPGGTKMDTASMLDEAVHYVKFLKKQVQALERAHHAKAPACWTSNSFSQGALINPANISNLNFSAFNSMTNPSLSNGLQFSAANSNNIMPLDRSGVS